jgi:LTXXQ motif family protein
MKWTTGGIIALSALITIGANDILAQQESADRRRAAVRHGPSVEAIMRMRDQLELTEDQLAALEAIRGESIQRRIAVAAEMAEMRSQLSAGQIERSELMAFMERRREASAGAADRQREQIDGILSEGQRASLQDTGARRRAVTRGRMSARRGSPGVRGRHNARGARPSMRGRRFDRGGVGSFRGARGPRAFRGARRSGEGRCSLQASRCRRGPGDDGS